MSITLHQADGTTKVLKEGLALQAGEVIDASRFVVVLQPSIHHQLEQMSMELL